ncbi:hypothetical protein NDU88_006510 [Pleurodeles waltl]|uniref:Uncharacterized protein n=1 Tax=Pleurodeles waltl TaxID=8319 RepID=A0AAV7N8U8_PLEWA|nr:hypothetical protein NDU88_006510 [Pleurodeles waltl]
MPHTSSAKGTADARETDRRTASKTAATAQLPAIHSKGGEVLCPRHINHRRQQPPASASSETTSDLLLTYFLVNFDSIDQPAPKQADLKVMKVKIKAG